jgi:O-antigen ligase
VITARLSFEGARGLLSVGAILAPSAFLVAGAAAGYAFTLDERVAAERLIGLLAAGVLAAGAMLGMQRLDRPHAALVGIAVLALFCGVWVIAATDPNLQTVLRGPIGGLLTPLLQPLVGAVHLTDPVAITNTRFIVGYNGLADLCLVAAFCCAAVLLERPRGPLRASLAGMLGLSLVLLAATGSRGALTGLAAGAAMVALVMWPRRQALLVLLGAPLIIGVAAVAVLDKGLEFSSTAGRVEYWGDLARLLVEYPLTGVGLGVNTANQVAMQYEINPDPERVAYAHNTFVQSYLEQGPLGFVGMLLVPLLAVFVAIAARRCGVLRGRRALLVAGLGVVASLEAHGLTDQVLTTNVGGLLVLLGLAAMLAALTPPGLALVAGWLERSIVVVVAVMTLVGLVMLVLPSGRAQALLNLGSLQLNRAAAASASERTQGLVDAEATLAAANALTPGHAAVLRQLARVQLARFDDTAAFGALRLASEAPRLDAFDMLQIAHVYRDLGAAQQAYAWAARAYATWNREPDDRVLLTYAQNTLANDAGGHRARTLAEQAEAAMRARAFGQAAHLFQQALAFAPTNAYLQDRLGGAERGIERYGSGPTIAFE